ncbi:SusC/RagA family TonB-linked outer membrane protein [Flavobacterium gawalongense]|uniref:SusC/RagA family TonB-linked outer membrane protein n=1 Tax=Flavobacterium gawalongense TaxID=2594432 RepID=A0A553BYV0_9FLAO|nr:SusC/RagA family TonB-linked outer membrane protein [Flavobacterium gawalongense]TRX01090.1 SusC/RagA family TonB-linked outer membrane protein [Flavobacterium gawalongense]TRX05675.1 SusC/RagA family TonB-linked outer membrane protein [Flavobacterium gawalongense]TRX13336.1 SusC/RagA family TonB-linked outer membrane protein [Flavobacterium gawalongense]TRX15734.1 SusC/RagA family TonB-linked outer membrane protein [Flavobacterium gawalongense]TRX31572.1 SusC/RagA family TonB-linked outer 
MKLKFNGFLVLLVVLVAQLTFAQERAVSGVVSDNAGLPLPGVSVLVKGTKSGTQTDFDGKFSIKATSSQVLIFSYIGMKTQEVMASSSTVNVKLKDDSVQLEGVVVTALGIKKQKRSLGYATANVGAKELTEVPNVNVFESLSGKVAGVDITAPAQVGASSKVIIRGYNSLSNSSPLYVVDGTPINNSSNGSSSNTRSFDAGNGVSDLDPNNIESMSILKGAAASALYGSRAANGVILITTKSAKNKSKISVEFLTSSDFSEVARVPHLQNDFGQGWNGKSWSSWAGSPNNASNENGSWGPAFNGEVRPWGAILNNAQQIKPYIALENNIQDFYEIGNTFTNSVRLSGGGENSNFSLNFSDVNSDGIIPSGADSYNRQTLGINSGITSEKLSAKISFNYIKKDQNAVNTGQGADAGEGNTLTQEMLQIPRDVSVVDLEDYKNNPYNNNSNYFSPYTNNPYWSIYENATKIDGNRFFGNVNLGYKINEKFSLNYQAGGDYRTEKIKSYGAVVSFEPGSAQANAGANAVVGGVTEQTNENTEFDTNLNLNYNTALSEDFNLNALLGFNSNERKGSSLTGQITNLDIPNFYELSNSSIKPAVLQNDFMRKSFGAYASLETSYKNQLFLTLTGRNDWTSTLPKGANSYFYPSVSVSGIVFDTPEYFLKLRAGYAEIGNDTGSYQTESALTQGFGALGNQVAGSAAILLPIGGVNGYEYASNLGNSALKPERTSELEFGFESNLFSKRVNIDASIYNKTTTDLLFRRPVATSTGFTTQTTNLLDVTNKGIELVLNVIPVKTNNFQWDFTTTFTKNNSEVTDVVGNVDKIQLASNYGVSFNAQVGQPLGVFSTFVPKTNDLGQYIIDGATGYYKVTDDEQIVGDSQRDFIMGFKNKLSYKNLALSFGIDWKQGGEMYSYTKRLSHFTGNGIETTYNDRNPFIIPNSVVEVVDAGGNVTGYAENTTSVSLENVTDFYNTGNNPGVEQFHVIDKTFVRLRDISLTYNVPSSIIKKMGLTNAAFSVFGKNLALWTPDENPYIDPELSTFGDGLLSEQGEFGANPSQRSYGASLKLTF